jgi:hypothetical protein
MTAQEKNKLVLGIWEYFRDHPDAKYKYSLPLELRSRANHVRRFCAFESAYISCISCEFDKCREIRDCFRLWLDAEDDETRRASAGKIVDLIIESGGIRC